MDVLVVHSAARETEFSAHSEARPLADRLRFNSSAEHCASRTGWIEKRLYYYTMCRHIVHRYADPCDTADLGFTASRTVGSHCLHRRRQFPKPRRRPNGCPRRCCFVSDLFRLEKWQGEHREVQSDPALLCRTRVHPIPTE